MSGGLAALLDDVAAITKAAAASLDDVGAAAGRAGVKATGVVIDDAAVTPRYVTGFTPDRELPVIWRIAKGSLFNKLVIILPIALLLSQFLPWLLTPILMVGGCYLSYEAAHKIWGALTGHHGQATAAPAAARGKEYEEQMVKGAITTDLILSAEIMVISLNEVADQPLLSRAIILTIVALGITALVYGVVAILVKMDDVGLRLTQREGGSRLGEALLKGMPHVMTVIGVVGIAAMMWVGGHILLVGADELGWHGPYGLVHGAELAVAGAVPPALAGFLGWLTNTLGSALAGFVVGSVIVGVAAVLPFSGRDASRGAKDEEVVVVATTHSPDQAGTETDQTGTETDQAGIETD